MRILHLYRSPPDAESIADRLKRQWPRCSVQQVNAWGAYVGALQVNGFDVVMADDALPAIDGLHALDLARKHCPEKPFILLADAMGGERAVEARLKGAVDCVPSQQTDLLVRVIDRVVAELGDRRRAASRIQELATLLDAVHDAVIVQRADGMITFWNHGAERLYGWTAREALGQDATELLLRQSERAQAVLKHVLAHGEWQGELKHRTKSGGDVAVKSRWTTIRGGAGGVESIVVINSDVTGTKMLETKFLRAQRMESVGMLVGGIAHDLSNVLAPILMSVDLLRTLAPTPQAQALIDAMSRSARHGEELVRHLLTFARGAEGQPVEVKPEPLLVEFANFMRPMLNGQTQLDLEVKTPLPVIRADTTQLKQVLMNLCINARDAMPDGGTIKITCTPVVVDVARARTIPEGHPGSYVMIAVEDQGTGIAPEILGRIFDPFFTTKDASHGTGLGLSTVRTIVKSHGGFVAVDSQPGSGSAFCIYLPVLTAAAAKPEPLAMPTILLADDEEMVRNTIALLLKADGYHVYSAENGEEAFKLFRQRQGEIDLVVTDLKMAGMDGFTLIKAVREEKPDLPVIALTGMANAEHEAAVRAVGARLLAKPMTRSALSKAVSSALAAAV